MRLPRLLVPLALAGGLVVIAGCKETTKVLGYVCPDGKAVCPPVVALGFSGASGGPSINTSPGGTTQSTTSSVVSLGGSTSAAGNGYWIIVVEDTVRASGVLAVGTGGTFSASVPLLCGVNIVIYTFSNASGRTYFRQDWTRTGCTSAHFRAQLTWDVGLDSDMDLHLLRPGGSANTSNDCYYFNCRSGILDWGPSGATGNPLLDVDDTDGFGPENITLSDAESGEYKVLVYNYNQTPGVHPTVKIYLSEREVLRLTTSPKNVDWPDRRWWYVARVNILTRTVVPVNTLSGSPPTGVAGQVTASHPVAKP